MRKFKIIYKNNLLILNIFFIFFLLYFSLNFLEIKYNLKEIFDYEINI